jgi:hypothetical protein
MEHLGVARSGSCLLWVVGGCGHCPALVCMEKVTAIFSPRLLGGAFHLFFDIQTSFYWEYFSFKLEIQGTLCRLYLVNEYETIL